MKGNCSDEQYDENYFKEIHTSIHGMTSPTELGYPNKEETEHRLYGSPPVSNMTAYQMEHLT